MSQPINKVLRWNNSNLQRSRVGIEQGSTDDIREKQDVNVRLSLSNPLKAGLNIAVNTGILLAHWYVK